MTITYELRVHSRDVSIAGIDLNKHTGYDLIAYDENGTAISIQTVDLNALSPLSGPIDFKMYSETLNIPIGGDIIPSKVYVDGEWENTSQQWVNENQYKNVALPLSSEDALEAFNKIKSYATLANTFLDMGLPISYDPTKQNCNSFVAEMNRNFMPEIDVFDELNKDEETPYHYIGEEYAFPASSLSSFDSVISSTIFSLLYYIDENNLNYEELSFSYVLTLSGLNFSIISDNNVIEEITKKINNYTLPDELREKIQTELSVAETSRSPLVLDLDGDGVETTGVENGTHFDHDGNDFAEQSGWVGSNDGLLVRDVNGNGVIDDGTELFGNNSVLSSGETAKNGFEALADLDSNNDGVFNSADTEWNNVKVWKDANGNGIVDEGELLSLEQTGVAGINVDYKASTTVDASGNEHKQTCTFIKTDGTTGSVHDVWFEIAA